MPAPSVLLWSSTSCSIQQVLIWQEEPFVRRQRKGTKTVTSVNSITIVGHRALEFKDNLMSIMRVRCGRESMEEKCGVNEGTKVKT